MNSTDIIAYVHDGAVYHPWCAAMIFNPSELNDTSPVFCGEETDGTMSCDRCHEWIDGYTLTTDGIAYCQEVLEDVTTEQALAYIRHDPLIGIEHRQDLINALVELLKDHGVTA